MNNAKIILNALDHKLNSSVELTIYGRAALTIGFPDHPQDFALSKDVDAIFPIGVAENLMETTDFWQAIDSLNKDLEPQGLYMTHFFTEDQVILTPEWFKKRIKINGKWKKLTIYRLSNLDLLLSKLMRYDPIDLDDALYIISRSNFTQREIKNALGKANIPDIPEIKEQFCLASKKILQLAKDKNLLKT